MAQHSQPYHMMEDSRRQPQFWTHPAHHRHHGHEDSEDESDQEPLLSHQQYSAPSPPSARNNRVRQSLIPWSPGQTLTSAESQTMMYAPPNGYRHGEDYTPMDDDQEAEEAQRRCCSTSNCCWWVFGRWCSCCRCCRPSTEDTQQMRDSLPQESRRRRSSSGGYCIKFLYVLLSVVTLGGLYYYSSRCSHQKWVMNPGESRSVATAGFLTDSVQVVSQTPSSFSSQNYASSNNNNETITRGMAVYAMGNPDCPPLTGPPVTLDSPPEEIVLLHNAFQYQYFYLNRGSTMQVTVQQIKGATNILVLKGTKVLARIQNKKKNPLYDEDAEDVITDLELAFSMETIVMERFSCAQEQAPIEFSFTSPSNDVYVLLYDNAAANEPAAFNVSYHMVLTTYDLEGLVPWCSHSAPVGPSSSSPFSEATSFTCPPLQVATAGCVIVEAIENHGDNTNATSDTVFLVGDGGVEVNLYTTRRWLYIGVLSVLPSSLLALLSCYRRRKRRRRRRQQQEYPYQYPPMPHRPHRRQASREGPNYHYIPTHPQEGSGSERELTDHEEEEGPRGRHNRNLSSTFASAAYEEEEGPRGRHNRNLSSTLTSAGQTTTSCPCASGAENGGQPTNDTTLIPAENVMVVDKEQEEQS